MDVNNLKRQIKRQDYKIGKQVFITVFTILSILLTVIPLSDFWSDDVLKKVLFLLAVVIFAFAITIIILFVKKKRNKKVVFSSEKAYVQFEYGDLNKILENDSNIDKCTIAIPANTKLDIVFDRNIIKKDSVHGICLNYIFRKRNKEIEKSILHNIKRKNENFNFDGEIGDWFILTPEDLEIDSKFDFLFVEANNVKKENGQDINEDPKREETLTAIQTLIKAVTSLDNKTEVYIPLVANGHARALSCLESLELIYSLLKYNKDSLFQNIHVVIYEKQKEYAPIYQLEKFYE